MYAETLKIGINDTFDTHLAHRIQKPTDYGHTKAKSLSNSLRPKLKSQSQINSWDVDIKAYLFVEIMVE